MTAVRPFWSIPANGVVPAASSPGGLSPLGVLDEAQVLSGIGGKLARFKQPRRVIVVDVLPRNAMGKVQKAVLRQEYGGLFA